MPNCLALVPHATSPRVAVLTPAQRLPPAMLKLTSQLLNCHGLGEQQPAAWFPPQKGAWEIALAHPQCTARHQSELMGLQLDRLVWRGVNRIKHNDIAE